MFNYFKKHVLATCAVVLALTLPKQVVAEEVVLTMIGNETVKVTGMLLEVTGSHYLVDSNLGPIRVQRDAFLCNGTTCPTATSATVENAGQIEWNVSLWGKRRAFTEHVERLAELVAEKTDSQFTLNISYGGLSPSRENLDNIAAGTFEMAQFCTGYHPEKTPLLSVLELPFLGVASLEQELALSLAVYNHPAVQADLSRWNATLLMPSPQPQKNIIGVGQPPMSLGDFRGMTVRATGGVRQAIEALGAESANLPSPEVAAALAEGTIQATAMAPHGHIAFGTVESGMWWTSNLNPGTSNCPVVVNTQALESLSTSNRVALLSSIEEALEHYVDHYNDVTMAAWRPALQDNQIIELSINGDILNAINEAVATPAANAWIEQNNAMGLPAQELYDLVTTLVSSE